MSLAPRDRRHGTANGYDNHGCRCERCTAAWRDYRRERSHRLGEHEPLADAIYRRRLLAELRDNHGTESRYRLGCRCDSCRAAVAQARRYRREANREATRAYDREYKRRCRAARA